MEVYELEVSNLFVSDKNVRKILSTEEDETSIQDLANDIENNGLLNPITVRKTTFNKYEIIAGQRRFLAIKKLNKLTIPCNVIDVDDQKAEELSLIENMQRNQMSYLDKVKSFSRLDTVYKGDKDKIVSAVHLSRNTIEKYLKISNLPDFVLQRMDRKDKKLTIDVAIELAKLYTNNQALPFNAIFDTIDNLPSSQQVSALKIFSKKDTNNIEDLLTITQDIVSATNNIQLAPPGPYVYETIEGNQKILMIPKELYTSVIDIVKFSKYEVKYWTDIT